MSQDNDELARRLNSIRDEAEPTPAPRATPVPQPAPAPRVLRPAAPGAPVPQSPAAKPLVPPQQFKRPASPAPTAPAYSAAAAAQPPAPVRRRVVKSPLLEPLRTLIPICITTAVICLAMLAWWLLADELDAIRVMDVTFAVLMGVLGGVTLIAAMANMLIVRRLMAAQNQAAAQ